MYEIFMTLQQNILGHNFVQESRNYLSNLLFLRKKFTKCVIVLVSMIYSSPKQHSKCYCAINVDVF